jgi:hypothetical protein
MAGEEEGRGDDQQDPFEGFVYTGEGGAERHGNPLEF